MGKRLHKSEIFNLTEFSTSMLFIRLLESPFNTSDIRDKVKDIISKHDDLEKDLSNVTDVKDTEILHLKKEIENLKTKVEIESIRAEIYNLKMLAQQK